MMNHAIATLAAIMAANAAYAAPPQPSPPWTASGKWNLDMQPANCTMGRAFKAEAQELSVGFVSEPPSGKFKLLLAIPASMFTGVSKEVQISAAGLPAANSLLIEQGLLGAHSRIISARFDRELLPQLLNAKEIVVQGAGTKLVVEIEGSAGVAGAMRNCEGDLFKSWHIDPAEAQLPASDDKAMQFFTSDDYPKDALAAHQEGKVGFIWRIDISGRVDMCQVVESSGVASLDEATCTLMKRRARYQPAMLDGKPAPSWARGSIIWTLPNQAARRPIG